MTKLYLIRHAEAEGNLYRIAQGQYNSALTDRGYRQVEALARRFADIHIDAVYASDLYRTCATASAIYQPKGLPLHRCPGLREICVGDWEQRTWGDIARTDPEQLENFNHYLERWQVNGAETPEQVRDRVLASVQDIAARHDGETVAVFSHGCAIRILLATIQGLSIAQLGGTPHGDNTAVSLVEVEHETMRVVFRDDNSHLRHPIYLAGEKVRQRATALEPGLYFEPLRLRSQEDLLAGSGLIAETGPTLVGCLPEGPVGLVQFQPEREAENGCGWISLAWIREDCRRRGFGMQLLGQAIAYYRPQGRRCLRLALTEADRSARDFCLDNGFAPVGRAGDGGEVLEKDISFRPEFLGA